ncbi:MAG: diguanylate cyclase [Gammaproteobacteria bacterium]|nr:diguanylate cyclase [Gammaproteobacteria bacterium]
MIKKRFVAIRFLLIFLPLVFFLVGLSAVYYFDEIKNEQRLLSSREVTEINYAQKNFHDSIREIVSDLLVLAKHRELSHLLNGGGGEYIHALSEEFLALAEHKKLYDQIRFLDDTGMEVVRINFNNSNPVIISGDELQNKKRRYYFTDTFSLEKGEIFVSPFDLNVENGVIEQPLKPMIRIGVPIFDRKGNKRGIFLLNVLGADMLKDYEEGISSHAMLINSDGYWLKGITPEDEWGFMYEDGKNRNFVHHFPNAWRKIMESDSGQFVNAAGMFTFKTVYPLHEGLKSSTGSGEVFGSSSKSLIAKDYYWKAVSFVPAAQIAVNSKKLFGRLFDINLVLITLFATISWLLVRTQLRHAQAEYRLRESELRHRSVTQTANDAIISADSEGNIIFWNKGAQAIFGYEKEDVLDKPVTMLMSERYREMHNEGIERLRATKKLRSGGKPLDLHGVRKNGQEFAIELSLAFWTTATGDIYFTGIIRDSSRRKRMEQELRILATTDGLTGLYSRNYFDKKLEDEYKRARRYETPISLMIIDIDFFKSINDGFGHQAGDAYLADLGSLTLEIIRDVDTAARYGGDEFVVILPSTISSDAELVAERLRKRVSGIKVGVEGQLTERTVSIGIVSLDAQSEMAMEDFIKAADEALYAAKEGGRNRVRTYSG